MARGDQPGEFEQLVLMAVLRLRDDAHGAPIRKVLRERAGRGVSFGAIYSTLRRLEDKGWVEHSREPAAGERGGRPRRVFSVTPAGMEALAAARERMARMAEGVPELERSPRRG